MKGKVLTGFVQQHSPQARGETRLPAGEEWKDSAGTLATNITECRILGGGLEREGDAKEEREGSGSGR